MAKSNRQRKHDRALRQAKTARKQAAAQQRQTEETVLRLAVERLEQVYDPATPAGELADLLLEQYGGAAILPGLTELLISKGSSAGRLVEAAEAMRAEETAQFVPVEDGGSYRLSLTCLTFAAAAAHTAGEAERARGLIDEALRYATDPEDFLRVAMHLRAHGRVADALDVIETLLRDDPGYDHAARVYGSTLEEAFGRFAADEPLSDCPCGGGGSWPDCCAPRERAALDRFGDRSGLVALQDAMAAFLARSEYGRAVTSEVSVWRSLTETEGWAAGERVPFLALAQEIALVTAKLSDEGENALEAFAADPATLPELAARALVWRGHLRYGLWQIAEPDPAPGLWCVDVVTGTERYVAFPDGLVDQFPRWGVLLGGILPVDGVWRSTGQAVRLRPSEADALAEIIADATDRVMRSLAGKSAKGAARQTPLPVPFGHALPHSVFAYQAGELPDEAVRLVSMIVGSLLLRLTGELHDYRAATTVTNGAAPPEQGGEKHWLDEQLPALNGLSPRQAAAQAQDRPRLEAQLREFEYEAGLLAAQGKEGLDTTWLRDELDMPRDPWPQRQR